MEPPVPDPYVVEKVSTFKFEDLEADMKTIVKNLKGRYHFLQNNNYMCNVGVV